jgi:hypothetical protein
MRLLAAVVQHPNSFAVLRHAINQKVTIWRFRTLSLWDGRGIGQSIVESKLWDTEAGKQAVVTAGVMEGYYRGTSSTLIGHCRTLPGHRL